MVKIGSGNSSSFTSLHFSLSAISLFVAALPFVAQVALPVAGSFPRGCHEEDVFADRDYTKGVIPEECIELHLGDLHFGDVGASAVAEALKDSTALTSLNLDYNGIGDQGAAALAEALKINSALKELMLENNNIGDAGAGALARALTVNKALVELDLKQNKIGVVGVTAFSAALEENGSLLGLFLEGSKEVDYRISESIENALLKNDLPNRLARAAEEERQHAAEEEARDASRGAEEAEEVLKLAIKKKKDAERTLQSVRDRLANTKVATLPPEVEEPAPGKFEGVIATAFDLGVEYIAADRGSSLARAIHARFDALVEPLLLVVQRKLTRLLNERASEILFSSVFNSQTNSSAGSAPVTFGKLSLASWAGKLHVQSKYVAELRKMGVCEAFDIGFLEERDLNEVVQADSSLMDAWWFDRAVVFTLRELQGKVTSDGETATGTHVDEL